MAGIFISYRREDAAAHARRLHDELAQRFGTRQVYSDVDSISHGENFTERIADLVGRAGAMLVVIGPNWLDARNSDGARRLDDPDDFVRRDIAAGLQRKVPVIPVLVGGATMPREEDLPADLASLAHRHSLTLSDADWYTGEARLAYALERLLLPAAEAASAPSAPPAPPAPAKRWWRRFARRSRPAPRPKPAPRPEPAPGLSAAELAEKRATGRAEPAGGSDPSASPGHDIVDCTVFAPASVVPGDAAFVQVFAHLLEQAEEAGGIAEKFDSTARPRAFRTLEAVVRRGSRLTFDLDFRRLTVADPVQSLVWNGRPASVQFSVETPEDARPGAYVGTVSVSLESVPIGHVKFKLDVVSPEEQRTEAPEPVGDAARRYRTAFVSYSSEDRRAVLERVQMLTPLGIDFFQDLLDLDPGDRWERELYLEIDRCDLFLLFWSSHAQSSRWVRNEVKYALSRQGPDELAPPEIRPVIIEGPPIPPPWPELAHLHFGDRLVYVMAGSGS